MKLLTMQKSRLPCYTMIVASLVATAAHASDWEYAGYAGAISKKGKDSLVFYDANSVQKTSGDLVRMWVKSIDLKTIERNFDKHKKEVVEAAAKKVAQHYRPRWFSLDSVVKQYGDEKRLNDDAILMIGYEVVANRGETPLDVQLYYEINCGKRQYKILDFSVFKANGEVTHKVNTTGEYNFISPDSNIEKLSTLVCQSPTK